MTTLRLRSGWRVTLPAGMTVEYIGSEKRPLIRFFGQIYTPEIDADFDSFKAGLMAMLKTYFDGSYESVALYLINNHFRKNGR